MPDRITVFLMGDRDVVPVGHFLRPRCRTERNLLKDVRTI
jgi:hypothetical protein